MPDTAEIRVLIVDNHVVVRHGLAAIINLEADMQVVGEGGDGLEAVASFQKNLPDVTLMDLRMPRMSGVEAITAIRAEFTGARIIVLTTYDGDEDIYRGLNAGAKGYLLKDAEPDELLDAIRAVHQDQSYVSPSVGAKLAERMQMPELSDREVEVLRLLATGKSNQEIGKTLSITERTVKFHVNNILSKLEVRDRTQATLVALKRGIAALEGSL
jgi:two-component system, NarL family, response regulator